ncbi:MAG: hypothetical protein DSY90_13470 [Deltaproteobacteria bacterium]|nr:MAG: hypothetical protein DSY90_13470 [Deltaproteobacteria bacterium]
MAAWPEPVRPGIIIWIKRILRSHRCHRVFPGTILALLVLICAGWTKSWTSIQAAAEKIESIQADFVQEKHLPFLVKPLESTGRFYFKRPGSVRWEYVSPLKSILVSHQGNTRRLVEENGAWIEDVGVKMAGMQVVMTQISQWMSGRFTDSTDFDARIADDGKVVLTPGNKALSRMIRRIELTLSDRPGVVDSVKVIEGDDAYTVWAFKNIQTNKPFKPTLFTVVP